MGESLELELQNLIIETCRVAGPLPAEIPAEAPLIGPDSPFGLDSLDAVEVVVAVQRKYNVRIDNQESSRKVLQSLATLAEFIRRQKQG
jgi:acyl carrier protein